MKLNKKSVASFLESFDDDMVHGVQQILSAFGVCGELREYAEEVITTRRDKARETAEQQKAKLQERIDRKRLEYEQQELMANEKDKYPGEPPKLPVIGKCPKCGSNMGGAFVAACETRKSGRFFVRECHACTYHAEVFKKKHRYIDVEGG